MRRKKTLALVPSVRDQVCPHDHVPYTGKVPCTGERRCSMCGAGWEEVQQDRAEDERSNKMRYTEYFVTPEAAAFVAKAMIFKKLPFECGRTYKSPTRCWSSGEEIVYHITVNEEHRDELIKAVADAGRYGTLDRGRP